MDSPQSLTFNAFQLKLAAIAAMLLDHIGAVFCPGILAFRMVGRIAAPIMAFFISEGYLKTGNIKRYMLRLFLFAVISMVPYALVFNRSPFNILFDLLLGLIAVYFSERVTQDYLKWLIVILAAITAILLKSDGMMGISTLIYLFFRYRNNRKAMVFSVVLLYTAVLVISALYYGLTRQETMLYNPVFWMKPLSLLALPLIFRYDGSRGRSLKYLFYAFYPAHLLVMLFLLYAL